MANGNYSVDVSGTLDVHTGTRSPRPTPPPPPPPSFYVHFAGIFAIIMAVASVITTARILFGLVELEEMLIQVVLAVGTGVVSAVAMSIGTRPPRKNAPPKPQ